METNGIRVRAGNRQRLEVEGMQGTRVVLTGTAVQAAGAEGQAKPG